MEASFGRLGEDKEVFMLLNRSVAERALEQAYKSNPGPWADHARYVALACQNIANRCPHLDGEKA